MASRAYAEYFDDGKIAGIVTLGTPHRGANNLSRLATGPGIGVRGQLAPGSEDLELLNTKIMPSTIKTFAIAAKTRFGDDDDVVQVDSQRNKVGSVSYWAGTTITDSSLLSNVQVLHLHETDNADARNAIKEKLLEWSR